MQEDKNNVIKAYNNIAGWFAENRYTGLLEKPYLDMLIHHIGKGAKVLDLGCGTGIPVITYLLQQGMQVLGVDASHSMLDIAIHNFPEVDFQQADMRNLSLHQKFDAIIAWHSFFHLPPEDQPPMFRIFSNHLNPGGILLFTSGTKHSEVLSFMGGENVYHGSLDTQEYRDLLELHQFKILQYREDDPECGNATIWMTQLA
ncbi:SAM-dependent methyltransferase [Filimonas zeae]|nr:class I SAM-dependent methyltransferase [Filimonas zeae]MDR6339468.1 SAM-dependent methyltransferase [Filimonas zeae]